VVPNPTDDKREAILDAAELQFTRYGFRRTSMQDIARETGVSRASLYLHFANKEEIFRALAEKLHEHSLRSAEQHLMGEGAAAEGIATRVEAALLEQMLPFLEIVAKSPHGSEIYDESSRLCGDLVLDYSKRFRELLTSAVAAAARSGEIDLEPLGLTAPSAAELLHLGGMGFKHAGPDVASVEKRVRRFVRVFFAGLGA